jgi:hypothetical protein
MADKYPQHEKLGKVKEEHAACGEFFEFLAGKDLLDESQAEALIAEFFEIDLDAFNAEADAMFG